jgi:hypothetical protein
VSSFADISNPELLFNCSGEATFTKKNGATVKRNVAIQTVDHQNSAYDSDLVAFCFANDLQVDHTFRVVLAQGTINGTALEFRYGKTIDLKIERMTDGANDVSYRGIYTYTNPNKTTLYADDLICTKH